MADLFDIKNVKGKFFLTLVVVALVVVLFIFAYLTPQRNKITTLEGELSRLDQERVEVARKAEDLAALKGRLPNIIRDKETLELLIPFEHEETEIVEFLHYIAELQEVTIEQISLSDPEALPLVKKADNQRSVEERQLSEALVGTIRRIDTTIQVSGLFWDVLGFLDQFKRTNRYFEIYTVEIPEEQGTHNESGALTLILHGHFYFYSSQRAKGTIAGDVTDFERMLRTEGLEEYIEEEKEEAEPDDAMPFVEELELEDSDEPEDAVSEGGGENGDSAGKIEDDGSAGEDGDGGGEELGALNIGKWADAPVLGLPLSRLVEECISLSEPVDVEVV